MEQMGMYYGFAIYTTNIVASQSFYSQQTSKLSIPGVRDRAIVFVNKVYNNSSFCRRGLEIRGRSYERWIALSNG